MISLFARIVTYATFYIGLLLVFLPARLLSWSGLDRPTGIGFWQIGGLVVAGIGALLVAWCVVTFAVVGRGTPAPFDPPRRLVIRGPYRRVRNPMYIGAGLALCGAALYFQSVFLTGYAGLFFLVNHLFVVGYEEPTLRRSFGEAYTDYCRTVGRWWPTMGGIPASAPAEMTLHDFLDFRYGPDGDAILRRLLEKGADPDARAGAHSETPLHVATRRCRLSAAGILLERGADIDAKTRFGKTAYAHAVRRGFDDLATLLSVRGGDTALNAADRLAVAVVTGRLDQARDILAAHPEAVRTGNPEEDRLLADVAGRNETEPVAFLIEAGADLTASGLDGGTPLHQAAWFGQPANARLLIQAGAPLERFDPTHRSSPLGWAVHGSRYSGGAAERRHRYADLVRMLLDAGARLEYPDRPGSEAYLERLRRDAPPEIGVLLPKGL